MKIGVLAEGFRRPVDEGIEMAARLGAQGVQLCAVGGALTPENMDPGAIRALKAHINDAGLEISAICGDLGEGGFAYPERNEMKIQQTQRIIELSVALSCPIITTHIGVVPLDGLNERYAVMQAACERIGRYAKERGAVLAVETGPERAETLRQFIESLGTDGVRVNFDPANLIMTLNQDALEACRALDTLIVHTHAKDGRCYALCDPDIMYEMPGAWDPEYDESRYCAELPLGQGDVDFPGYLKHLKAIGYQGYLTIEREAGDDPATDIGNAIQFLRNQLQAL